MVVPSGLVTLLFTDIEGSTRAWEAHPNEMRAALARHDELLRDQIELAGGYVFKTVGDAFCAAFQDASSAVASAVDIQRSLAAELWPDSTPLRVRMALHSGPCDERDGDYFGPTVNRAARLEAVAHGGQVLLSQLTADLVVEALDDQVWLRDLGEHRLRDLGRPERVFQVCAPGIALEFPPLHSLDDPGLEHNLPRQLSSFVGREREVAEVRGFLRDSRLVTLAGPGGVGKTRLALQVAADSLEASGDGAWFVDLAPIADPALVPASVATVLGIREEAGRSARDSIIGGLQDRKLLLVLDNCEQVIEAVASLGECILRGCPRVVLLATSREPLAIAGEQVYRVPSLSLPPEQVTESGQLAEFEAVRLFAERARQQRPGFVLENGNAAAVARLCRRLDGIPLAIELAAARTRSMSIEDLEGRLDHRFSLLTSGSRTALPRQQTMRALVDWSYDLLSPVEQAVLARLSVFAGGFDLYAAEAVCAGGDVEPLDVVDSMDALVDKSLVQAEDAPGCARYRLLETMRDYAASRLGELDEAERSRLSRAHRDHFLRLAESAAPHLRGFHEVEWANRLDLEVDNLRIAVAYCAADSDPEPGLRLGDALAEFWILRGHGAEGAAALCCQLDRPETQEPTPLRGRALAAAGRLVADYLAKYSDAVVLAEQALEIGRRANDDALVVRALTVIACARNRQGEFEACLQAAEEALPLARRFDDPRPAAILLNQKGCAQDGLGHDCQSSFEESVELSRLGCDRRGMAEGMANLGVAALFARDVDRASDFLNGATAIFRELGAQRGLAVCDLNAGYAEYLKGDHGAARQRFRGGLEIGRRIGARPVVANAILGLALTAARSDQGERAATLHGVFDGMFEQLGASVEPLEARLRHEDHVRVRAVLGEEAFERAYNRGRHTSFDNAVVLALAADQAP